MLYYRPFGVERRTSKFPGCLVDVKKAYLRRRTAAQVFGDLMCLARSGMSPQVHAVDAIECTDIDIVSH
jgi:hypothetical protein